MLNHPDFISKVEVDENAEDERSIHLSWVDELLDKPHTCFDHETCIPCKTAVYKKRKLEGTEVTV